jgi:hypothetical protein
VAVVGEAAQLWLVCQVALVAVAVMGQTQGARVHLVKEVREAQVSPQQVVAAAAVN